MSLLILSSGCRTLNFVQKLSSCLRLPLRTLLSTQYSCDIEWNKRLDHDDTLKHISTERYFFELNQKYQKKQSVSAIDIDIFINSLRRWESQLELEHIIKQFRQTPKTVDTLDSTHHAICRFYLSNEKRTELLALLNNRIQFGVFPDQYTYNILLDQCIKAEEWEESFQVVKLMMLQEDSGNDITKTLALYALNRILINGKFGPKESVLMEDKSKSEDNPEDEEIEYIRVPFLTNPYFDDHFDLVNPDHILGKSMYFFGRELEKSYSDDDEKILANTNMVIGLIFFQKWERLNILLDRLSSKEKFKLTSESPQVIETHLKLLKCDSSKMELKQIKSRLEQISEVISEKTMSDLIDKRIANLPNLESIDIEDMRDMFEKFTTRRRIILNEQMERVLHNQLYKEIEQKKKEFEKRKRLYYFFENFPKHEIDFVEAEKRIKEIRSKMVVEENYVPPERY